MACSSTGLRPAEAEELGITIVPLRLTVGDERDLRDLVDISPQEVYRRLRSGEPCTTAAPAVGDYVAAFDAVDGPVLCLTVGAAISSMHSTAVMAARSAQNREVTVVDSRTAAGGLRLLALAAARMASSGLSPQELEQGVRALCERVHMAGMIESVDYLARTGRIPDVAAWGSSLLKVRPVVRFEGGKAQLHRLVRGRRSGVRELAELVARGGRDQGMEPGGSGLVATVFEGETEGGGFGLLEELRERLPSAKLSASELTPAMGVHTGPGVVGVAFYVDRHALGEAAA